MRTISLTYVPTGTNAKTAITFTAGEALRFSFTPTVSYDATGKTFRLVFSDTPNDAPLFNSVDFTFISAAAGTFYFDSSELATFEFPSDPATNGELWNVTDGILVRRITAGVTANPRASGDAPAYPDPPIDWTDVDNTPTTLSGYGITDAVPSSRTLTINGAAYDLSANRSWTVSGAVAWGAITGTLSAQTDLQSALDAKAPLASPNFTGLITFAGGELVRSDGLISYGLLHNPPFTLFEGVWQQLGPIDITGSTIQLSLGSTILNSSGGTIIDAAGNFTGAFLGNASTATALATARAIYGNNFDGSAALTQAVAVGFGGTGRATSTTAYGIICAGTTATGAHQTLAAGATTEILVGGGASALPVWTTATGSGAPVRATSPTLVTPVIGAATGTSLDVTGFLKDGGGVRLASNFAVAGSTTFADITGFSVNVNAGETYIIDAYLQILADATGGCKLQFSGTCTRTSMRVSLPLFDTSMANNSGGFGGIDSIKGITALNTAVTDGGTGVTGGAYRITGTILVATSGTLTLQFAQNSASGTSTVFAGSYYSVRRIG